MPIAWQLVATRPPDARVLILEDNLNAAQSLRVPKPPKKVAVRQTPLDGWRVTDGGPRVTVGGRRGVSGAALGDSVLLVDRVPSSWPHPR